MSELVKLETPREGVALVTLSLEDFGGHVSWSAAAALGTALREAREGGVRVAVLASDNEGHWYEHAWLPDLCNMIDGRPTSADASGWFEALTEITATHVVSIAAISGDCSGGGAEIGWACDLRVAEEQAMFRQPEVMLGIGTGIGGTSRLARLIGRTVTAEMVLDGAPVSARRIYELGGLNRVVAQGQAIETSVAWASRLADRPPAALATLKQMMIDNDNLSLAKALANEQELFQKVARTKEAMEIMQTTQARLDAGESIRKVYGPPRD
jgi:enoyl-CoA hydratase/carnithine racemase